MSDRGIDFPERKHSDKNDKNKNIDPQIKKEMENVCPGGVVNRAKAARLYEKHRNDPEYADKVMKGCRKERERIIKIAKDAAEEIRHHYEKRQKPMHVILERMMKHKEREGWSDEQYNAFVRELRHILSGHPRLEEEDRIRYAMDKSHVSKLLGHRFETDEECRSKLNVSEKDMGIVNEIIELYRKSLNLYNTVLKQSLTTEDCDIASFLGKYDANKNNMADKIHPLWMALFGVKTDYVETRAVRANIGRIIETRKKGGRMFEPDIVLTYDFVTDINDVVYDITSPIKDMQLRQEVQVRLWQVILDLRSGRYYSPSSNRLMESLSKIRPNLFDDPDLSIADDDISLLRKFMSAFSMRPILVQTTSMSFAQSTPAFGGINFGGQPIAFGGIPSVTVNTIPTIVIQLVPHFGDDEQPPKNIADEIKSRTIWIQEGGMVVPKSASIIASQFLPIVIDRKIKETHLRSNFTSYANPIRFAQLPMVSSGGMFTQINDAPIHFDFQMNVAGEIFLLKSVVCATVTRIAAGSHITSYITGRIALLICNGDFGQKFFRYDPEGAAMIVGDMANGYCTNAPVTEISQANLDNDDDNYNSLGFNSLVRHYSTVLFYGVAAMRPF